MPPSRKDEMRLRLQKKLNTSKIDYHINMCGHSFSVPVSMKPEQLAMLEKKGQEGRQLLGHVMHMALRDVLTRLPWQCMSCGESNAMHTFGSPIYVPPRGKDNELERIVREVYRDDKGNTIDGAHIRDKTPMFYCGSEECLKRVQRAAEQRNQRIQQSRDNQLERVKYYATIDGVEFYSLIRLTEAQLTALDGRGHDAAVVLDRCMIPGLKMILNQEIAAGQPKGGPWNCMICSTVPATEVYGSPMWIPVEEGANETEKFVDDLYRSDSGGDGNGGDGDGNGDGNGDCDGAVEHPEETPPEKCHHMRDKAPFFYCGSSACKQEVHRRIDKVNRNILLSVKKKLGKDAPEFDASCCCSSCGSIVFQSVKETCPRCRGTSYCNPECREKAWPTHRDDCFPAEKARSQKRGKVKRKKNPRKK